MHIQEQRELESVSKASVRVALRCFTDAELLWQQAKISLPWQTGVGWGPV